MQDAIQQAKPYARRLGGEASYWSLGLLQTFLAEGKDTDGRFTLGEGLARQGSEPPRTPTPARTRPTTSWRAS